MTSFRSLSIERIGHAISDGASDAVADRDDCREWHHVPLGANLNDNDDWTAARVRELVAACHGALRENLEIQTGEDSTPLADLAYEAEDLEELLTTADIAQLIPGSVPLPPEGRDSKGRWREVLGELGLSTIVDVFDALDILRDDLEREPDWYVAFAGLAERHGLFASFVSRPSLLLANGRVTAAPAHGDAWVLVRHASPKALSTRLRLARALHPAYFLADTPTADFVSRLESQSALYEHRNAAADVFAILGRGSVTSDDTDAVRLEDADLLALRDAWARLPRERHAELGPKVGRRVELKAIWYGSDGKRASGWARPVDIYLPAAIDREVDSFAKAAGRAARLKWADPEYAKLLKQKEGRSAIGAQKLLVAWGVAREPRLIRPNDEVAPWARDTRAASPIATDMRTDDQLRSIRAYQWVDHLLEDHWSPDADIVAADVAKAALGGKSLYLLRNADTKSKGLGFATAGSFYPDFLLWLVDEQTGQQWLSLVDPKGIRQVDLGDPKLQLYREIKSVEAELDDPLLTLNAFILSTTDFENLINVGNVADRDTLEQQHLLFMGQGRDAYLTKLIDRTLAVAA